MFGEGQDWFFTPPTSTTYTLTSAPTTIAGGTGYAVIDATTGTLIAGDVIDPAGVHNTLVLIGAGVFDMALPTTFANIQLVKGDPAAAQTVTLAPSDYLTFIGGNGNDTVTALAADDQIVLGNGNNTIQGGSGTDSIAVGSGNNQITAGSGFTTVTLGSGHNTVVGGSGNLVVTSTNGTDTITGGTAQTTVYAGAGTDTITSGASGSLTVNAGIGTTTVNAITGNDTIIAGQGNTTAALGSGTDVIKLVHGTGTVQVTGFIPGTDTIDVSGLTLTSFSNLQADSTISSTASGTTIQFHYGPTIDLVGVTSVSAADFTFGHAHPGVFSG